jgi:DNA polymerase III epsilon subunit-like protein
MLPNHADQSAGKVTIVSVDVETAGPVPSQYPLLAIGACTLGSPRETFYVELKPDRPRSVPSAVSISGLSLSELELAGLEPALAMAQFEQWLERVTLPGQRPLMAAYNAPFDWMFVADYFHRYLGRNPLGHAALDIKSFLMGATGVSWPETSMAFIAPRFLGKADLVHHGLQDALDQADILTALMQPPFRKDATDE